jgi:hypothetical protein
MEQHFGFHSLPKLQASTPATPPKAARPSSWLGHGGEPLLPLSDDLDSMLFWLRDQPCLTTLKLPYRSCVTG